MKSTLMNVVLSVLTLIVGLSFARQASAQKPLDVTIVNETHAPVSVVITAPEREEIGNLAVKESITVEFNRGEVVEISQRRKLLKRVVVSKTETIRIRNAATPVPDNSAPALPRPTRYQAEAKKAAKYVNQIRANPPAFVRLHQSLGNVDVKEMPALNWNTALQEAAQRKVNWMAATGKLDHVMKIGRRRVGMNQWMREAGYPLEDHFSNAATNFEVLYGADGPVGGISTSAINSFMSEGKDGGHVMPLLGRGAWTSCTDIGAAIATDPSGMNYVSILVGVSPAASAAVAKGPLPWTKVSIVPVNVTWKNLDDQPITVHWIDAKGKEGRFTQVIKPGQMSGAGSFETHVFVFRKGGKRIKVLTLNGQRQQHYDIWDPASPPTPPRRVQRRERG